MRALCGGEISNKPELQGWNRKVAIAMRPQSKNPLATVNKAEWERQLNAENVALFSPGTKSKTNVLSGLLLSELTKLSLDINNTKMISDFCL